MPPRAIILVLACLMLLGMTCPAASMAAAAQVTKTVMLDGKTVQVPEEKLTQGTTPVDTFLFIGSWRIKVGDNRSPSPCRIASANDTILIESHENPLKNATTRVLTQDSMDAFLNNISWGQRQATHVAFKVVSPERQPAVVKISTDSEAALYHNGRLASIVRATNAKNSEDRGYFPIVLQPGENIINVRQNSGHGKPRMRMAVCLDSSMDFRAAWLPRNSFLKTLVHAPGEHAEPIRLDWDPGLNRFFVSLELRDASTGRTVFRKERARRGMVTDDEDAVLNLPPGIYEAIYQSGDEGASEFFIVGNPDDLHAGLRDIFSKYDLDAESRLAIEAPLRRARILLAEDNYKTGNRQWQEKLACTFSCLAGLKRKLAEGVANIAKDQPGLHIRGFASKSDNSFQSYRLYIPSTYNPGTPLPLLVIPSARVTNRRPFIEGPTMANHVEALRWAKHAEKHGFALLWPGWRSLPEGFTYESAHIEETIQSVERNHNIDKHRISIYANCGAGYGAGRLVTEYNNRFAAIVYDRAIFELSLDKIQAPPLLEWLATINPARHVIGNRNVKIFVMHDDTRPEGHGPLELTTRFLEQAGKTRNDVVSHLPKRPMTDAGRMDMVFSWLAKCRNENPGNRRSGFPSKAGYTGPIKEIFATPILVVEGTQAQGAGLEAIQAVTKSLKLDYMKHFHGAECMVKKDTDVTQKDIDNHSLILIGNPWSNSVWEKLQPQLPVKTISALVMYESQPFQAIVRHPRAVDKYVLMMGAVDLKNLGQIITASLFTACHDAITFAPIRIISKLDSLNTTKAKPVSGQNEQN